MVEQQITRVPFGGITDIEGAKRVAFQIFQTYDLNKNGQIDNNEVSPMMVDAYRAMNKGFNPSPADVQTYVRILDRNEDGRVTLEDIEQLAIKYLVGEGQNYQGQNFSLSNYQPQNQNQPIQMGGGEQQQEEGYKQSRRQEKTKKAGKQRSQAIEQRLDVARRLFKQFDRDGNGVLDEDEIPALIMETYKVMGITNFKPTQEDVKLWIQMGDQNNDGTVDLPEYEEVVINSLKKAGIQID